MCLHPREIVADRHQERLKTLLWVIYLNGEYIAWARRHATTKHLDGFGSFAFGTPESCSLPPRFAPCEENK